MHKRAQESVLKIVTGMNNDINPLGFRSKYEKDRVTLDVYNRVAPGWSTLSGGSHPQVTLAPAVIADFVTRAADMVPFIRSAPIHIIRKETNAKESVSLEALKSINATVQEVPNLHVKPQQRGSTGEMDAASKHAIDVLREEVKILKDFIANMSAPASEASGSSAASQSASPARTADPQTMKANGKKRARRA